MPIRSVAEASSAGSLPCGRRDALSAAAATSETRALIMSPTEGEHISQQWVQPGEAPGDTAETAEPVRNGRRPSVHVRSRRGVVRVIVESTRWPVRGLDRSWRSRSRISPTITTSGSERDRAQRCGEGQAYARVDLHPADATSRNSTDPDRDDVDLGAA
jgi:hypothetical protein